MTIRKRGDEAYGGALPAGAQVPAAAPARPPEKTCDRARPPRGGRVRSGGGRQRLKQPGPGPAGCTLFTTLLAACHVLHRKPRRSGMSWWGCRRRDRRSWAGRPGRPLRELPPHPAHRGSRAALRRYLRDLRSIVMDANDNQEYTYGALVEELALPRDPSRVPLVSASFNLDRDLGLSFHGLEWTYVPMPRTFSKLDIDLNVIETDGELLLEIDHNTDLIDRATALRWMEHYEDLLRSIAEEPGRRIADMEPVSRSRAGPAHRRWWRSVRAGSPLRTHRGALRGLGGRAAVRTGRGVRGSDGLVPRAERPGRPDREPGAPRHGRRGGGPVSV